VGVCGSKKHSMSTFLELGLKEPINKALTDLGYDIENNILQKSSRNIN